MYLWRSAYSSQPAVVVAIGGNDDGNTIWRYRPGLTAPQKHDNSVSPPVVVFDSVPVSGAVAYPGATTVEVEIDGFRTEAVDGRWSATIPRPENSESFNISVIADDAVVSVEGDDHSER